MLESLNNLIFKSEPKSSALISEIVSFKVAISPVKLTSLKWVLSNKKTRRNVNLVLIPSIDFL